MIQEKVEGVERVEGLRVKRGGIMIEDDEDEGAADHGPHRPLEEDVEVLCPHCGEAVVIALDVSGGTTQDYVQDCEVCCRPWRVQVHYAGGAPEVTVEAA